MKEGLHAIDFSQVEVVKEQEQPDPHLSTVKSPNPEEHAACYPDTRASLVKSNVGLL